MVVYTPLTLCIQETLKWVSFANSEDPDEMQHIAAFHQGLHCLLRLKQPPGTEIHPDLDNPTSDPLSTQWTVPYSMEQYVWENPSEYKGLSRYISNYQENPLYVVFYFIRSFVLW